MELVYRKEQATNVFQVELIYIYNDKVKTIQMEDKEYFWQTDIQLSDGEYLYKFILNNGIRINDPNAYRYAKWLNGETWSVLKIHDGTPITKEYQKTELVNFRVHNGIIGYGDRTVVYPKNTRCYISFDLNNVCDVHSVMALWYQPDGSLYHIEESTIDADVDINSNYSETFWVNLNQNTHPFKYGIWMVEIYVDGDRKIREYFRVNQGVLQQNLMNFVV